MFLTENGTEEVPCSKTTTETQTSHCAWSKRARLHLKWQWNLMLSQHGTCFPGMPNTRVNGSSRLELRFHKATIVQQHLKKPIVWRSEVHKMSTREIYSYAKELSKSKQQSWLRGPNQVFSAWMILS